MQIDTQSLRQLIKLDEQATALFEQGRYGDCAVRCVELAPKVPKVLKLSKIGVVDIYMADRAIGHLVLDRLKELAKTNRDAELMIEFMGVGVPEVSYPDFALPEIRMLLTAPQPLGLGLTPQQAAPLLVAGEQPDTITGQDVESLGGVL